MQIVERGGDRMVVLPAALLHEEDHRHVVARQKKTGQKFSEALADYVAGLRKGALDVTLDEAVGAIGG